MSRTLIMLSLLAAGMFIFLYGLTPPNIDISDGNVAPIQVR